MWAEPNFTAFPFGFDGHARHGPANPPFRVGSETGAALPETDWSPRGNQPLVYATFGTTVSARPGRDSIFQIALDAVADLDVEVLLTTGRQFDISSLGKIPDNAIVRNFIPQAAVFPHAAAMICHGGSGTLLGGFASGLPQVIAPQSADQPYNADLTQAGGFGLHVNASSADEMHHAVRRVLSDPDIAESVSRLRDEMRSMPAYGVVAQKIAALA
jgi:MGT family glycosyltransferase